MLEISYKERVLAAIEKTKQVLPEHWQTLLKSRCEPTHIGSYYPVQTPVELQALLASTLDAAGAQPLHSNLITAGCCGFTTPLPGFLGLASILKEKRYTLLDPKNTGFVECCISGSSVKPHSTQTTTIILSKEGEDEVVATFHPGRPIVPSTVPADGNVGRIITGQEALDMGFLFAKITD
jgi:hypothetical protein